MWVLKVVIFLPLLTFFVMFLVQNNELVALWPFADLQIAVSVVYFVLFCLGYIAGRLFAWSAYAPLRSMVRKQRKEHKQLSKEHEKLNLEREKLNKQVVSLQDEVDNKNEKSEGFSLNKKIKGWFSHPEVDDK
ncbi:MAG: LapA family protein [Alphaproteobacteria bacterium]|nr:LapA family protein [Alphaproteobacteria bacterium]